MCIRDRLDFNLGERWIPAKVYSAFASEFFETEITVSYQSTMDEYVLPVSYTHLDVYKRQV